MIDFYTTVFAVTFCSLLLMPYLIALAYIRYSEIPKHHILDRGMKLWSVIAWSMWTVISVIVMLWSALALTNNIFSRLGFLS
jgi:hypothetical protein